MSHLSKSSKDKEGNNTIKPLRHIHLSLVFQNRSQFGKVLFGKEARDWHSLIQIEVLRKTNFCIENEDKMKQLTLSILVGRTCLETLCPNKTDN